MSITVFIRTPSEVHPVEISGNETLRSLHDKAAEAAGVTTISLEYEGAFLQNNPNHRVHDTDLVEGCELLVAKRDTFHVHIDSLEKQEKSIKLHLKETPNLLLVVDASEQYGTSLNFALPQGVKRLKIEDSTDRREKVSGCKILRDNGGCGSLVEMVVDLPLATGVHWGFLACFASLERVDLSNMTEMKTVEGSFLSNCPNLMSVDLPPSLTAVGDDFLSGNSNLTSINLSALRGVVTIRDKFLASSGITTVDLSPLANVRKIGFFFLSRTPLRAVDVSPLKHAEDIGGMFLFGCVFLKQVDLSPLQVDVKSWVDYESSSEEDPFPFLLFD